jgi:hypothetical protein
MFWFDAKSLNVCVKSGQRSKDYNTFIGNVNISKYGIDPYITDEEKGTLK